MSLHQNAAVLLNDGLRSKFQGHSGPKSCENNVSDIVSGPQAPGLAVTQGPTFGMSES